MLACRPARRALKGFLHHLFTPFRRRHQNETMDDVRRAAWSMGIDFDSVLKNSRDPVKEILTKVQAAKARDESKESAAAPIVENQKVPLTRTVPRREVKPINAIAQVDANHNMSDCENPEMQKAARSFCLAFARTLSRFSTPATASENPDEIIVPNVPSDQFFCNAHLLAQEQSKPLSPNIRSLLAAFQLPKTVEIEEYSQGSPQRKIVKMFGPWPSQDLSHETALKNSHSAASMGASETIQRNKEQEEVVLPQTISTGEYGTWQMCLVKAKKPDNES